MAARRKRKLTDGQQLHVRDLLEMEAAYLREFGWALAEQERPGYVLLWRDPEDTDETLLHDQAVAKQKARVVDITERR